MKVKTFFRISLGVLIYLVVYYWWLYLFDCNIPHYISSQFIKLEKGQTYLYSSSFSSFDPNPFEMKIDTITIIDLKGNYVLYWDHHFNKNKKQYYFSTETWFFKTQIKEIK